MVCSWERREFHSTIFSSSFSSLPVSALNSVLLFSSVSSFSLLDPRITRLPFGICFIQSGTFLVEVSPFSVPHFSASVFGMLVPPGFLTVVAAVLPDALVPELADWLPDAVEPRR